MSIWQYKRTQTTWQRIDYLPKAATVMDIVVDDYANCWIGSEYSGIWQCINGKWKQVTNNKNQMGGLRFNGPFKLYRDNQGRIWSIHLLDGLSLYEAGKWYSVMIDTQQEGESHSYWRRETANSAYFDPDHQRIWFTTHSAEIGWIDLDQEISVTPQHIQEYYASLMIPKS